MASVVFVVLHKLDEGLLVYKPCILSVAEHTNISQAQLDKALVDEVYGRMDIESNGSLVICVRIAQR